jgi:hypothetical protein
MLFTLKKILINFKHRHKVSKNDSTAKRLKKAI